MLILGTIKRLRITGFPKRGFQVGLYVQKSVAHTL